MRGIKTTMLAVAIILFLLFMFGCREEVANPACAKLEQLYHYADSARWTTMPMEIRAIKLGNNNYDIVGCSLYEARMYWLNYDCENYPNKFEDIYRVLWWDGTKCEENNLV